MQEPNWFSVNMDTGEYTPTSLDIEDATELEGERQD